MFTITVNDWLKSYENLRGVTVTGDKYSEGEFKRVTGGKAYFAMVGIRIIPDNKLTFEILLPEEEKEIIIREEWFESICMGVLDVMLTHPFVPITQFKCVISKIKHHAIDSSPKAFRMAARFAAKKALDN